MPFGQLDDDTGRCMSAQCSDEPADGSDVVDHVMADDDVGDGTVGRGAGPPAEHRRAGNPPPCRRLGELIEHLDLLIGTRDVVEQAAERQARTPAAAADIEHGAPDSE